MNDLADASIEELVAELATRKKVRKIEAPSELYVHIVGWKNNFTDMKALPSLQGPGTILLIEE